MAEQLELRALMAADLGLDPTLSQQPVAAEVGAMVPGASVATPAASASEIVFVDPGVTDPQSLMQGLRTGVEFVMLDGSQDGIAQISAYLQGKSGIQAIHLVGHGRAGEIYLGSSVLGNGTLSSYAGELARIGGALTSDGDILVYGCETAQGEQGEQFLQQLARLTSADVAGSNDITGAASLGGDWDLEEKVGEVGAALFANDASLHRYDGTFAVTLGGTQSYTGSINTAIQLAGITATSTLSGSTNFLSITIAPVGSPTGTLALGTIPSSSDLNGAITAGAGNTITLSGASGASKRPWPVVYSATADSYFKPAATNASYALPTFTATAAGTYTLRISARDVSTGTAVTRDLTITVQGSAPVVDLNGGTAGINNTVTFTEDGAAALIAATSATITDADSANLQSLTVSLTNRPDTTAESLSFTSTAGITGTYDSGTGVLLLSVSPNTTVANYQTVLRSITYNNTSQSPTTTNRLITAVASDGTNSSAVATATVTVVAVNDAPVLDSTKSVSMTAVNEDNPAPTAGSSTSSTLVSTLLNVSGLISDVDAGALQGIAITAVNANGTLWYSTAATPAWTAVGTVSNTSALLLASDANTRLHFVPAANYNGTITDVFTFRAWDQTSGTAGSKVNTSTNGGTTAFSTATDTVTIVVNAVNDAPVATGSASLTAILEDTANPPGATVQSLFSGNFDDSIDTVTGGSSANAFAGIAIASYTVNSAQGQWQYSANGTTGWTNLASVAARSSATIIPTGHSLRFLPAANFAGSAPTITAHLIDDSSGAVSFQTGLNITTVGATTQYSNATVVLSHTITAVNDAPTVTAPTTFTVTEDVASNLLYTGTPFADVDSTNLTVTLSVADGTITGATVAGITLGGTATARTFSGTVSALNTYFTTAGNITYTTAANSTASRTLTTLVSDSLLSASADSTINVTAVNDAPTVSAPATFTVTEDVAGNLLYTGTPFADVDSTNLTVTLSVADGTISGALATGITIGGTATARTFAGSVSDLNTYFTTAGNITYTTALNNTAQRTLTTSVSDGALSASANSTINVTAVNDAPVRLTGTMPTISVNEDSANSTAVTLGLSAFTYGPGGGSDESSQTLTYTITSIPSFVNIFKSGGVNQVTVNSTVSLSELQNLVYKTVANANGSGTLQWTVVDNGGTANSGSNTLTESLSITVAAVNDAPVVYLGGGTTLNVLRQFTEGSAVNIAPSAVIGDVDTTQLQSLTITLTNAQNAGAEVLNVTGNTDGFTVTGNGTTTVTISGNQSLAAYSTLLQSVTYNNTSENPTTSPVRTITVVARDNAGADSVDSAASTSSVALASINNPPVYNTGIVNQTLTAGLPFSFSFPTNAFTDAESDPLTYTAGVAGGALPAWLTFSATSRKFYGVPPTLTSPGITVTVTAKDPSGGTATKDFTITTVATLNGNSIASVGFATAYDLVNPQVHSNSGFYQEETNSFTTASSPFQGTNFVFFQDGVTSFSGNNVPGKLMYINSSGDVVTVPSAGIGSVSRPIKTPGNVVKGYYMWNNAGTTGSVSDDTATLLVVDPNYFTGSAIYNSSSDQVDTALNGYLTAVTFDIASASAVEGTASPNNINFVLTRSSALGTATVQYATSISGIDTASANDFAAASGTYTFPDGSLTGTLSIATRNDAVFENNETFTLTLSNPLVNDGQIVQGRLINSTATGTITNDDTAVFTVAASGAEEGTPPGLGNAMTFTVTRVGSSAVSQTISYATALRGTGSGFASADDFTSVSGTLTFLAGETTKTFTVTTVPDNVDEPNEEFDVVLTNPTSGASVSPSNGSAVGTIEDDETNTIYSVASSGITEGGTITFTITRSRLVDTPQTISFYTSTTGDTATSGTDFTARVTGDQTVTFATNELTKQITVSTIDDTLYEGNETLTVVLDALQNLGVGYSTKISTFNGSAKGTILDDETAPVFSVTAIDGDTVESVDGIGQTIRFRVSRNIVSQADQTVDYATVIGTATEDDFVPVAGTLTFPNSGPDSLSQTVTVTLKNDAIVESTEAFTLQISNPTGGATLGTSSATGTILDSNKPPVAGGTITTLEDTSYVIQPANIYTDPEGSGLSAIDITGLPDSSMGYLQTATTRDANGVPLEAGWVDITAPGEFQISGLSGIGVDGLRFKPALNKFTTTTPVTFTLRVNDGAVWSTAAGTVTINITPVNDAPAGTDVSPAQSAYVGGFITLTESMFTLSDADDAPQQNNFLGVVFTDVPERPNPPTVPNKGSLQVQVGENSTSRTGTITGARDIRTSAFSQSTNTGSPQFVNADSGSWTYDGIRTIEA